MEISLEDGRFLVRLARKAIEAYLESGQGIKIQPPPETPKSLWKSGGVFVTLNARGKERYDSLRGCIGFPYPILPLVKATVEAAIAAATEDPRFYPLSQDELSSVVIEVSVLSEPVEVEVQKRDELPSKVRVGEHGLIVQRGTLSGLLLPQVAVEYKWTSEEFLEETCVKAGLSPDAWMESGTKVLTFTADVFAEEEPGGEVTRKLFSEKKPVE